MVSYGVYFWEENIIFKFYLWVGRGFLYLGLDVVEFVGFRYYLGCQGRQQLGVFFLFYGVFSLVVYEMYLYLSIYFQDYIVSINFFKRCRIRSGERGKSVQGIYDINVLWQ